MLRLQIASRSQRYGISGLEIVLMPIPHLTRAAAALPSEELG